MTIMSKKIREKTRKNFELDNVKDADIIAFMNESPVSDVAMFRTAMRLMISSGVFKQPVLMRDDNSSASAETSKVVSQGKMKTENNKKNNEKQAEDAKNLVLNFRAPSDQDFK